MGPGGIPMGQQPVYQQGSDGQFHQVGFMATPGFVAAPQGYAMGQPQFVQQQPVVYVQQAGPGQISYQQQPQPIPSAPEPSPAKKKQDKDDDAGGCCLCVLCAALVAGCVVYFKAATGME